VLVVAVVAELGCTNEVESDDMSNKGIPPWHLWGSSETVEINGGAPGAIPSFAQQLAQIRYGRPDSWRFVFQMVLTDVGTGNPGAANFFLNWNLTLGLGRSVIRIPAFATFELIPADFVVNKTLTISSTELVSERAARISPNLIEEFPAQTIQMDTDGSFDAANTVAGAHMRLSAFFAPVTHIRPEWQLHQFPGNEDKGQ